MKILQKELRKNKDKLTHNQPLQVVGFHGCDKEDGEVERMI